MVLAWMRMMGADRSNITDQRCSGAVDDPVPALRVLRLAGRDPARLGRLGAVLLGLEGRVT